ncbi:unnamed protein product [Dovyalis caffra]|uniref:Uncharacterized protein n=1 Tax=Dovyalis caffra TaxID=77055 RepID=A0AAV1RMJ4_9ROSI|nr:unnamed protein product [Dovyalis caffra]
MEAGKWSEKERDVIPRSHKMNEERRRRRSRLDPTARYTTFCNLLRTKQISCQPMPLWWMAGMLTIDAMSGGRPEALPTKHSLE